MPLFQRKRPDYEWYPQCKPITKATESGTLEIECNLSERFGATREGASEPLRAVVQGKDLIITSTGGASARQIELFRKWAKKNVIK